MTTQSKLLFPQPFPEKYRPRRIADFLGLALPKKAITAFIKNPYPSYWLFIGSSGLGKTAFCQAMAGELNAELQEIPSAECDLETAARTLRTCQFGAFDFTSGHACEWHIVGIHEADSMTPAAQRYFLSKMDSTAPPPRTILVFTCNSKANLEARFLSRCNELKFEQESLEDELGPYLARIYKKEGGKRSINFEELAKAVNFNVRDALNKLQVEILLGNDRKGLPTGELKVLPEHAHECEKCHKPWKHSALKCKLPHVTVCQQCGGVVSVGRLAALKAHRTLAAKTIEKYEAEKRAKRKKGRSA